MKTRIFNVQVVKVSRQLLSPFSRELMAPPPPGRGTKVPFSVQAVPFSPRLCHVLLTPRYSTGKRSPHTHHTPSFFLSFFTPKTKFSSRLSDADVYLALFVSFLFFSVLSCNRCLSWTHHIIYVGVKLKEWHAFLPPSQGSALSILKSSSNVPKISTRSLPRSVLFRLDVSFQTARIG